MTAETKYREIEVAGTPRELGRQIGEAARDEIRGFCEIAMQRVNKTVAVSRQAAMAVAAQCIEPAKDYSADMIEELRGTAEAAGVRLEDLMLLQVRNQLCPDEEAGCTSFSLAGTAGSTTGTFVAQNWDNDSALDEFTVVLTRRPQGKPAVMNLTQAGLIAYIGFNDAGIGLCLNTLPAPSREIGVPHYFTVRGIYETSSLDGAAEAVRRARRAIPANIILATPEGPADLEVTIDNVHVLRAAERMSHTNHCLHPGLTAINNDFPELIQSKPRKRRIDELLDRFEGPPSLQDVKSALTDHDNHPYSICRHVNDDPITGFWQSVFSVIIEPDSGQMHVSRGTPCDHPYETYLLR